MPRLAGDGSFGRADLVPTSSTGRPDYLYYGSITETSISGCQAMH